MKITNKVGPPPVISIEKLEEGDCFLYKGAQDSEEELHILCKFYQRIGPKETWMVKLSNGWLRQVVGYEIVTPVNISISIDSIRTKNG